MVTNEFEGGKTNTIQKQDQHNQAAYRMEQIQKENQQTIAHREEAPGAIQAGSAKEAQVRQDAMNQEQQAYVSGQFSQKGSTKDQFQQARLDALKSGSFNYANVSYASKGTPASYVNKEGERISVPQGKIIGGGSATSSSGTIPVSKEETTVISTKAGGTRTVTGEAALIERLTKNISSSKPKSVPPVPFAKIRSVPPVPFAKIRSVPPVPAASTTLAQSKVPNMRERLAGMQGEAARIIKPSEPTTEAVPFLSFSSPIQVNVKPSEGRGIKGGTGQKVSISLTPTKGTEQVPETSVLDALQFVPIGGLAAGAARSAARSSGSLSGKIITSTGEVIVPKGVKPAEEKTIFDTVREAFTKPKETMSPKDNLILVEGRYLPYSETAISSKTVSLGRGIGKEVPTGYKEGGLSSRTKPSGKPPGESPTTKTTTGKTGQSLEQIVKEKETPKTEPKTNYLGQGSKETELLTGKGKGRLETPETIFIPKPPGTKQKQGTEQIPVIPILTGGKQITQPVQTPKEKEKIGVVDLLTTSISHQTPSKSEQTTIADLIQTTKQSGKQEQTPISITDQITLSKEQPQNEPSPSDIFGSLGGSLTGGGGRGESSGSVKTFFGNVPLSDIVGVYKGEEISYSTRGRETRGKSEVKSKALGSFVKNKRTKLF